MNRSCCWLVHLVLWNNEQSAVEQTVISILSMLLMTDFYLYVVGSFGLAHREDAQPIALYSALICVSIWFDLLKPTIFPCMITRVFSPFFSLSVRSLLNCLFFLLTFIDWSGVTNIYLLHCLTLLTVWHTRPSLFFDWLLVDVPLSILVSPLPPQSNYILSMCASYLHVFHR